MAAPLVKTQTPGIYKRETRYVFGYRVSGKNSVGVVQDAPGGGPCESPANGAFWSRGVNDGANVGPSAAG